MLITCPDCLTQNQITEARARLNPACVHCGHGLLSGEVMELNEANFDAIVSNTEVPVLVDFWAAWSGPCRMMGAQYVLAARQLKGRVALFRVDVDKNPRLVQRFAVRSHPTMLMFMRGQEIQRHAGAMGLAQIIEWATQDCMASGWSDL